jgi:hypothetical protein
MAIGFPDIYAAARPLDSALPTVQSDCTWKRVSRESSKPFGAVLQCCTFKHNIA